jgi:hypothetical protein
MKEGKGEDEKEGNVGEGKGTERKVEENERKEKKRKERNEGNEGSDACENERVVLYTLTYTRTSASHLRFSTLGVSLLS